MKRTLISYDVFESIQNESLINVEFELVEATAILARALNEENLNLVSYDTNKVVYETEEGDLVRSNYEVNKDSIEFSNIEQLILDEESEINSAKNVLSQMLDAILDNNKDKADELLQGYVALPTYQRAISEGLELVASASTGHGRKSNRRGKQRAGGHAAAIKAARTRKRHSRMMSPVMKKKAERLRAVAAKKLGGRKLQTGKGQRSVRTYLRAVTPGQKSKKMREWASLYENVATYLDVKEYGTFLSESVLSHDDKGNVTAVRVPTVAARNEAKVLSMNYKTLDSNLKVLRSGAKKLAENIDFCKNVANLRRQNALSDNLKMQEALEDIVGKFSSVLYLTQNELSKIVAEALEAVNATNYDDQTCDFMAEAILSVAHETYAERVQKLLTLAGATIEEGQDAYSVFRDVADSYFPHLDENHAAEMQVYVDLYEALRDVYGMAQTCKNEEVMQISAQHLNELAAIIEQSVEPSLDVAMSAAEWLNDIVESNLEGDEWNVSNNVHTTINGDHPQMNKNASKGYTPSSDFSGDWGDIAPVGDGKGFKNGLADEMRNNSWGNIGGEGTYPSLNNPYLPKPYGSYEIKGEKTIDGDSDQLAHSGGKDAWPSLTNPHTPAATQVKMKSDNLVQDK